MTERLCGLETEYAFTALDSQGRRLERATALEWLMERARATLPHLPDMHSAGIFLQNGARFYVDHGLHPAMSTPECMNPWDAVRYVLAGERILMRLAEDVVAQKNPAAQVQFFRCNVDYSGTRATWGCHESYLHRGTPALFPQQLIPHLVSRLIYTGAGGLNPLSPGIEFTLSPRVPHLTRVVSDESTHDRGIFHTKDESLSGKGYHRLHILCGESLCSETAAWLKVGTTALIVAMIEAGLQPGAAVALRSPLEAMRRFAGDPTCTLTVPTVNGRNLTALMIQRHYLTLAETHVGEAFMPSWAAEVCRQWRAVLDGLEYDSESLDRVLDWRMKLALFRGRVRRYGIVWESLPMRQEKGVEPFLAMRQELCEIDMRFGQLGTGIFAVLNRTKVLAHHLPGVENIEQAVSDPPRDGRARVRGACIRRLANQDDRYVCDWQRVWDTQENRMLDLGDPFASEEYWKDEFAGEERAGRANWRLRLQARFATLRREVPSRLRIL